MEGLPSPQGSGAWRFRLLWLGTALFVLLIFIVLISPLPTQIHRIASGIGLLVGGVASALACYQQSRRSTEKRRVRAWRLFGLAAVVGTSANMWLFWAGPPSETGTGGSPADVFVVLALLLGVAAVITFPSVPRRPPEVIRIVLDGFVLGGSVLFFASVTLFPQIVGPEGDLAARAVPLLVPVIDILVATTALLLYFRRTTVDGRLLLLVSFGFGLFAVSDFNSAIVTASGPFDYGSVFDIFWIAGYLLVAVGIVTWTIGKGVQVDSAEDGSAVAGTALMFTVFLVGAVVSLRQDRNDALGTVSLILWFLVLSGVVARQVTLIIDNERLRRGLQQRVIERNRDLRTLSQRTDLLVDSVADGIYGVDRTGHVTFANPVAARILGYEPDAVIGLNAHEAFHGPQANGEPFPAETCYINEAIESGAVTTAEEDSYVRADGRTIPVEVTASPTTDDGESIGAVVVFRDITQRLEVDRMKDEFVSIVSHELRTPLTSIRGALGLVESGSLGGLTPQAQRMVSIALDSSVRLGRLINDILDVERIHSGVLPMNLGVHPARDLIEVAVEQVDLLADRAQIRIEIGCTDGTVLADSDRITQTLINLIDNAVKFSSAHSAISISTERVGAFVEFVIRDSGRGVPSDKLDSIFRRFEQVDSSDARDRGGTGLGLAISRSIVERHNGRIWAENNADGGATFRFTIPSANVGSTSGDPAGAELMKDSGEAAGPPSTMSGVPTY